MPDTGYHFVDWSGAVTSGSNPVSVVMDADKSVVASFAVNTYTLGITAENGVVVRNPDKASYNYGETVVLEAVPDTGYHFVDWSGAVTGGSNPVSVVMDADKSITANFGVSIIDQNAPTVTNCLPAAGAIQVPINNLMILDVVDAGTGVDGNSVTIRVNNNLVYAGNTEDYVSVYGRCRRTGAEAAYTFVYQSNEVFDFDYKVSVAVNAKDLVGNTMEEYVYSFATEMCSFGVNKKVNSSLDGSHEEMPATVRDDSGNVWVVWQAGPEGGRDIHVGKLVPGAVFFSESVRITNSVDDQCSPDIAVGTDGRLYVVWQDNRRGNWDIYISISTDGTNWSLERIVTDSNDNQINPAIVVDRLSPNRAHIVWQDGRNGNQDIYIATSSNGFLSKTVSQITSDGSDQVEPAIAVDADNVVYVVWADTRADSGDIYGAASNYGPWANTVVVSKGGRQSSPAIAAESSGSILHVLWIDDTPGDSDIFYAGTEGGLPATPLTGRSVIDDTSGADQLEPAIVVTGSSGSNLRVFACWKDERNLGGGSQDTDLYFVVIGELSSTNVFVTDDGTNANQSSPAIDVDEHGYPYLVWVDDRNDGRDVYYAGSSYAGPDVLASQDVSISAGAIVGTDPEAITGVQDVSITIPAGAFVCDLKISISSVENPQNLGFERLSLPYEFGPSGVHFSQPATITIPYEVPGPGWSASAYWYNPLTGTLSQQGIADIETMVISPTLHALRFKTAHLTQFLVGGIESGSTGGGGGGGGGCSMSRCAQVSATEFLLPYVGLALAMVIIRLRDGGTRKLHEC
ncbi:MAG: InlB B-repeat-containing protein [Planctomycetota bacterium]